MAPSPGQGALGFNCADTPDRRRARARAKTVKEDCQGGPGGIGEERGRGSSEFPSYTTVHVPTNGYATSYTTDSASVRSASGQQHLLVHGSKQ